MATAIRRKNQIKMKRYTCNISYKCSNQSLISNLLAIAIKNLGFEPKYMSLFFDEFSKPANDLPYDETAMFALLKRLPGSITIKNKLYDEDNPEASSGFSLALITNEHFPLQSCILTWSNNNLDFLLNKNDFQLFIGFENLIYCYCYDQYDCYQQSYTRRINSEFDKSLEVEYRSGEFIFDDVIDISKHWGRSINARGLSFMAAPVMWFGSEFYKIISKEAFLNYENSSLMSYLSADVIRVNLFDLYDDASKEENRNKQKEFWEFFDLQNKIHLYEQESPVDFMKWLKDRATIKQNMKKK